MSANVMSVVVRVNFVALLLFLISFFVCLFFECKQ